MTLGKVLIGLYVTSAAVCMPIHFFATRNLDALSPKEERATTSRRNTVIQAYSKSLGNYTNTNNTSCTESNNTRSAHYLAR